VQLLVFNQISVEENKTKYCFFLNFLLAVRETKQIRAEILTTLAVGDRLYSEVEENVPDPSPLTANRKEIEIILEQVDIICFFFKYKFTENNKF
jgi:hypothetical protein